MRVLITLCIILQILDGVLTGYASQVSSYGTAVEGNPLVRYIMEVVGVVPGLFLVKGGAILMLMLLARLGVGRVALSIVFILYFFVVLLWVKVIFMGYLK